MKRHGGQTFGRYVLERELGSGGMGEVWEAHDPTLDRRVAIKFVRAALSSNASYVARLEREALAAARIKHENVGRVYDLGTEGDQLYLVMELIEGVDLRTLLERVPGGRLDMVRACYFMWQVLQGLAAAHAAGVVHRDLKPENVMVSEGGHVTVIDFGLAGEGPQSGLGTARFLSPEAVDGAPADARADLYAVGLMLYMALAGEGPYPEVRAPDAEERAVVAAHLFAEPAPLGEEQGFPDELWRVVQRLLRKAPRERFQTAEDAAGALAHCLTGSVPPSHPLGVLIAGVQAPRHTLPPSLTHTWTPSPPSLRLFEEPTAPLPAEPIAPLSARAAATRPEAASPASSSRLAWGPRGSFPAATGRRLSPWIAVALLFVVSPVAVGRLLSSRTVMATPAALPLPSVLPPIITPDPAAPAAVPEPDPMSSALVPAPGPAPAPDTASTALTQAPPIPSLVPRAPKRAVRPVPVATAAPTATVAVTASVMAPARAPSRRPFNVEE